MFRPRHAQEMRTPQQERSRATQARLLDATVDSLVELGWAGTTTTVDRRAGRRLPRRPAAPLPDQGDPGDGRRRAPRRPPGRRDPAPRAASLPAEGAPRVDRVIDMLAAAFTGPLYAAALEVWIAARTDPELRVALVPRRRPGSAVRCTGSPSSCSGADERRTGVRESVQATLDLHARPGRGQPALRRHGPARHPAPVRWKRHLADVIRD